MTELFLPLTTRNTDIDAQITTDTHFAFVTEKGLRSGYIEESTFDEIPDYVIQFILEQSLIGVYSIIREHHHYTDTIHVTYAHIPFNLLNDLYKYMIKVKQNGWF